MKVSKGMKRLDSLLERYRNVKVIIPETLFDIEPEWSYLQKRCCPVCGNKLLAMGNRPLAYCRGKRHPNRKSFVISLEKLARLSTGK